MVSRDVQKIFSFVLFLLTDIEPPKQFHNFPDLDISIANNFKSQVMFWDTLMSTGASIPPHPGRRSPPLPKEIGRRKNFG